VGNVGWLSSADQSDTGAGERHVPSERSHHVGEDRDEVRAVVTDGPPRLQLDVLIPAHILRMRESFWFCT
jgi:hypothetical protein